MNFALIGHGYWGPHYGRIISTSNQHRLRWVVDINPKKSLQVKKLYPRTQFTTRLIDIFKDKQTQAAIIATPSSTHYQIAKACLIHNLPCLVEKPFTTSPKTALSLYRLAKNKQIPVLVGHTYIYSNPLRWIKTYLATKKIGKILFAHSTRTNFGPIRTDVNSLWDIASHEVSLGHHLFGSKPKVIQANGNQEFTVATLKFPECPLYHLHVSWLEPQKVRKLVIVGTKQMLIWDDTKLNQKITIYPVNRPPVSPPYAKVGVPKPILIPRLKNQEPLKQELEDFVRAIVKENAPQSDLKHGLDVVTTLQSIDQRL